LCCSWLPAKILDPCICFLQIWYGLGPRSRTPSCTCSHGYSSLSKPQKSPISPVMKQQKNPSFFLIDFSSYLQLISSLSSFFLLLFISPSRKHYHTSYPPGSSAWQLFMSPSPLFPFTRILCKSCMIRVGFPLICPWTSASAFLPRYDISCALCYFGSGSLRASPLLSRIHICLAASISIKSCH